MASTSGEEHPMPTMASAQGVAEDAISNVQASTSSNQLASGMNPSSPGIMHPLLLAATCKGDMIELSYLLNREQPADMMPPQDFLELLAAYTSGCCPNGSLGLQRAAAADVEQGTTVEAPSPASLLEGVTMEGDTALHVVAANGDSEVFMNCADLIHGKDRTFLSKQNTKGDTPLHCAARAGNSRMISHLVGLARSEGMSLEDLLRKENCSKETVLHEAVRIGDNQIVKNLLTADPELACFPKEGTSPLYLAISLEEDNIAETLHEKSKDKVLSYSGPNGQNALHAAVLHGPVHTRRVLEWKKDLATKADENGSTPLHFAAGGTGDELLPRPGRKCCEIVLEANTAALYQPDHQGLFPIHVAASEGAADIVAMFVEWCHGCSRLRDAKGRTFLHVAIEKERCSVVSYACGRKASLAWILNMQDNDGNTALHLAVKAMDLVMVGKVLGRREVKLNLTNAKGETPLDTAEYMIPPGPLWYVCKDGVRDIHYLLKFIGATSGVSRRDHFKDKYENIHGVKADREAIQAKVLKESTQNLVVGSVLVATATFGAAFAMPGGYRQDDHPNGGTPTLARNDAFNGFVIADATAFLFSSMATAGFMCSGNSKADLLKREVYFLFSRRFLYASIITMVLAFGLGLEAMLHPVTPEVVNNTFLVLLLNCTACTLHTHYLDKWGQMETPIRTRKGPVWTLRMLVWLLLLLLFMGCIPILFKLVGQYFLKDFFTKQNMY